MVQGLWLIDEMFSSIKNNLDQHNNNDSNNNQNNN